MLVAKQILFRMAGRALFHPYPENDYKGAWSKIDIKLHERIELNGTSGQEQEGQGRVNQAQAQHKQDADQQGWAILIKHGDLLIII